MVEGRLGISEVPVDGRVTGVVRTLFFTGETEEGEIDFIRPGIDRPLKDLPLSEIEDSEGCPPED